MIPPIGRINPSLLSVSSGIPSQPAGYPLMMHLDCGELTGEDRDAAIQKSSDMTGDKYEDFPADEDSEMSGEKVLKISTEIKDFGNTAFKAGDLSLGIEKYQKALRYLQEHPAKEENDSDDLWNGLQALRFTCHSNSSLLMNKQKQYRDAEEAAGKALEIEGIQGKDEAKARYRRATARLALKDEEGALEDLVKAEKLVPEDKAVQEHLRITRERIRERKEKEKQKLKKFFA